MTLLIIFISAAAATSLTLGVLVFFANRKRKVNQAFLFACTCLFLWLLSNLLIILADTPRGAMHTLTSAYAISACIPTAFQLLRFAIKHPNEGWPRILAAARLQIIANVLICASCFFPTFIEEVSFPVLADGTLGLATPRYGTPYFLFNVYYVISIVVFAFNLNKGRFSLVGAQRAEFEFLGFACFAGLVTGLLFGTMSALVLKTSAPVPIAHAASVFALVIIVAYGIAVHRILAVAVILRTITAYVLLISYLICIYSIIWYGLNSILLRLSLTNPLPAHIAATIAVAFSMAPVHGRFQKVADRLVNAQTLDIPLAMRKAGEIFQSVTTIDSLLHRYTELLLSALSTTDVRILLNSGGQFVQRFPRSHIRHSPVLPSSSLTNLVTKTKDPVSYDALLRTRQTEEITSAIDEMSALEANVVTGIFSKDQLEGLVVFGLRTAGKSYDKAEQDALQILCNQFAVALENARLYTEVQDSKIQNEIMLDRLVSGVVVADPDRKITLFNHEAQKITGISDKNAVGENIAILPREIYLALEVTLENRNGIRNIDAKLYPESDSDDAAKNIRMGSAFLFGHDGKPMGALLVFTDITELRALEEQVRRSDQLSSVGTLAAGMAHEIKNPLVTIKTFTQLLPQRYDDDDFRKDFSSLVAQEVERINGIVNELLSFSKPAKPHLVEMDAQEMIDQTLKLIQEQLSQKNIALHNNCKAHSTRIFGDRKLLSQALINLNLNAIEAIEDGGTITVGTINCSYRFANGDSPDKATRRKCFRIQITDNGHGIEREKLQQIFDPFFTSKSEGTGMGLSVAHGIISEHHGVIEVESEPGRGTTFYIYIPLFEEGAPA